MDNKAHTTGAEKIYPFLRFRLIAVLSSVALFVAMIAVAQLRGGFIMGVDFQGGVKLIAQFDKGVTTAKIREVLTKSNINAMVQQIGQEDKYEYVIATKLLTADKSSEKSFQVLDSTLRKTFPNMKTHSIETVGPSIGDYLKKKTWQMGLLALVMMIIYLTIRFDLKYAAGCIVAVIHDVVLTVGFCGALQVEVNVPVIAALLTIFGYSVNDTIVIFDRIRENVQGKVKLPLIGVIDKSITQTLSRTIYTNLMVIFVVAVLYFLGGEVINDFAFVLLFGCVVGTYSTIYIASPIVVWWEKLFGKKAAA